MKDETKTITSYKEIQIGKTLYRVTSVFTGENHVGGNRVHPPSGPSNS